MSGELRPTSGLILCEYEDLARFSPARLALRRAVMTQAIQVPSPFLPTKSCASGSMVLDASPRESAPGSSSNVSRRPMRFPSQRSLCYPVRRGAEARPIRSSPRADRGRPDRP